MASTIDATASAPQGDHMEMENLPYQLGCPKKCVWGGLPVRAMAKEPREGTRLKCHYSQRQNLLMLIRNLTEINCWKCNSALELDFGRLKEEDGLLPEDEIFTSDDSASESEDDDVEQDAPRLLTEEALFSEEDDQDYSPEA